jgi:protein-disulfide isomerase
MQYDFRAALVAALSLTALASAVVIAPAYAAAISADAVEAAIEANPEMVGNALMKLQAKSQADEQRRADEAISPVAQRILRGDPMVGIVGNPKGTHRIVEFFDYNCGYCKLFATKSLNPLLSSDPQAVVHLVQTPILGPGSRRMAEMAAAAQMQGPARFRAAHDWLLQQRAGTAADADGLRSALVTSARLDKTAFDRALADGSAARIVDHNADLARKAGVNGTPAIYAGRKVFKGMIELPMLKQAVSGR